MPDSWAKMEEMFTLTSQNPLSLLMKFGMMGWNDTCAENCSGHGECHNGTCLCEVISSYFYFHFTYVFH